MKGTVLNPPLEEPVLAGCQGEGGKVLGEEGAMIHEADSLDNEAQAPQAEKNIEAPKWVATESEGKILAIPWGYRWVLLWVDLAIMLAASLLGSWARLGDPFLILRGYVPACVLFLFMHPAVLYVFDLYNVNRGFHFREIALRAAVALGMSGTAAAALFYIVPQWELGRGILLIHLVAAWGGVTLWRQGFASFFQGRRSRPPVLILGAGTRGLSAYSLLSCPFSPYEVIGFLDEDYKRKLRLMGQVPILGGIENLRSLCEELGVRAAVLATPHGARFKLLREVLKAKLAGIEILEVPRLFETLAKRIPVEHIEDQWFIGEQGFQILARDYVRKIKRLVDIGFSALALLVMAPLFVLIALLIKLDSAGPVFYGQKRVGQGSRLFKVWKFRSMRVDAEKEGAVWARENDDRVTRVGRWLRLSHLDELPQLWNVLLGDMSLVGPRPERPEFVEALEREIPYYFVRHSVQPGITGWAQINYRYGASVQDSQRKLEYDLYYIKNMSLLLDLKILLRTLGVALFGEGSR